MAGESVISVVGNLTGDPELKYVGEGMPVANFTVAQTPRNFNKQTNEWEDGETMFVRCSVWRDYAENVAESLTKGSRVIVTGKLTVRSYQRTDGSQGTSIELQVDEVGPSLRYATASVSRNDRTGASGGVQGSGGGVTYQNGFSASESNLGGSGGWGQAQAQQPQQQQQARPQQQQQFGYGDNPPF